jgi:hypothetical protein
VSNLISTIRVALSRGDHCTFGRRSKNFRRGSIWIFFSRSILPAASDGLGANFCLEMLYIITFYFDRLSKVFFEAGKQVGRLLPLFCTMTRFKVLTQSYFPILSCSKLGVNRYTYEILYDKRGCALFYRIRNVFFYK